MNKNIEGIEIKKVGIYGRGWEPNTTATSTINTIKNQIDYIQSYTLSQLLNKINTHNKEYPNNPILKNDIVDILKEGESYILLYYK